MKVGDKAIVVKCNYDANDYKYKVGTIVQIDLYQLDNGIFLFPYRIELEDKSLFWCMAIPYSPLIEELF